MVLLPAAPTKALLVRAQGIHTWLEDRSLPSSPGEASGDDAEPASACAAGAALAAARTAFAVPDAAQDAPSALPGTPFEGWAAHGADGWGSEAEYASDEFDSGAETEREEGSDVTVMCDSD